MQNFAQDLTYSFRKLRSAPGFALTAIGTLALGIGATTAVFSVVYAALFRPLPFPDADRLVAVFNTTRSTAKSFEGVSPPDFADWRSQARGFSAMAAIDKENRTLTGAGDPQTIPGAYVTGDFFSVMGMRPQIGRPFTADEEAYGHSEVAMISDGLWRRAFGGRPTILGTPIQLDGNPVVVVGVAPRGFVYPSQTDVWTSLTFSSQILTTQRGAHYLSVLGRLQPNVSIQAAAREMGAVAARLADMYPTTNANEGATAEPFRNTLVESTPRRALIVMLGGVLLVTLIACANVANLLLARGAVSRSEIAVRRALGAAPSDLVRLALTESVVLATCGGMVGLVVGAMLTRVLAALRPAALAAIGSVHLDPAVLLFTAAISLATGLMFGIVPAWQSARTTDLQTTLRETGRSGTGGTRAHQARQALIAAELALSVVLLIGASLLIETFARLQKVDRGYDPSGVVTFGVSLPAARYPRPDQAAAFYRDLTARLAADARVVAAGATNVLPLDGSYQFSVTSLNGQKIPSAAQPSTQARIVTADAFRALGMRVARGRTFNAGDRQDGLGAVVVNRAAARLLWKDADPIGKEVYIGTHFGLGQQHPYGGGQVVGIVDDIHDDGPGALPRPSIYLAHSQFPITDLSMIVRLRGGDGFARVLPEIRREVAGLDPQLPLADVRALSDMDAAAVSQPRFVALLLATFAAVALLLSVIGVYGVMSYLVNQRRREFGIRVALGASGFALVRNALRGALPPAIVGIVCGLAAAIDLSQLMQSLLFGVSPTDLPVFTAVPLLLLAVAAGAAYLPARRAKSVDPVIALRSE